MLLYSMMQAIMGMTAFWTKTDFHVSWIVGAFMTVFAGSAIPLWFFPAPLKAVADCLPFKYMIFEPLNIFLGKTTFEQAILVLIMQAGWTLVLFFAGRVIWRYARRVITIQGG